MADVRDLPAELVRVQQEMGSFFDDPIPRNLKREEIARRKAIYLKELQQLENDIEQTAILETESKATSEAELAKTRKSLETLTDITFNLIKNNLNVDGVTRSYELAGSCLGIQFTLRFDVADATSMVQSLVAEVSPDHEPDFRPLLARSNQDRSLQLFFKYLALYARSSQARAAVFRQLREARPAEVLLPQGARSSHLFFTSRTTGCGFVFNWGLRFNESGRLVQRTNIFPKVTGHLSRLDQAQVLAQLPEKFEFLMSLKGPAAALEIMMRLMGRQRLN